MHLNDSTQKHEMADRFWTSANGVMLLLFLFAGAVQLNDPDPLIWVGIYVAAAAVCGLEIRRRTPLWAPPALALITLVWAGSIYYRVRGVPVSLLFAEWEMRDLRIEEAREMHGLAIVGMWMLAIVIVRRLRARA